MFAIVAVLNAIGLYALRDHVSPFDRGPTPERGGGRPDRKRPWIGRTRQYVLRQWESETIAG